MVVAINQAYTLPQATVLTGPVVASLLGRPGQTLWSEDDQTGVREELSAGNTIPRPPIGDTYTVYATATSTLALAHITSHQAATIETDLIRLA